MHLRKNGRILLYAAALLAYPGQPAGAFTKTFTAKVSYSASAVVSTSPPPAPSAPLPLPVPPNPSTFMDSYGFTWAAYGGFRQTGAVTIADSRTQFMNFLASNLQPDNDSEMLKVVCAVSGSPPSSCGQLLTPDGKNKTIYLGMNVLVKNDAKDNDPALILADASPSFDITVVYQ